MPNRQLATVIVVIGGMLIGICLAAVLGGAFIAGLESRNGTLSDLFAPGSTPSATITPQSSPPPASTEPPTSVPTPNVPTAAPPPTATVSRPAPTTGPAQLVNCFQRLCNGDSTVVVNTGSCLNVRSRAGVSNSVVSCLRDGMAVTLTGDAQLADGAYWWPIRWSGGSGWATSEYLRPVR